MRLTGLNLIFFLSFTYFAHRNIDKKAWLWVTIYLVGAFCCGLAVMQMYFPPIYLGILLLLVVPALMLFFMQDGVLAWIWRHRMPSPILLSLKDRTPARSSSSATNDAPL
jgi:Transmembrane family 220, helix